MSILRTFLCLFCAILAPQISCAPPQEWSAYLMPWTCPGLLTQSRGFPTFRYLLGVHRKNGEYWHEILNVVEYDTEGPFLTTRYFRTFEPKAPPTDGEEPAFLPRAAYLEKLLSIRRFANAKYRYRRPWQETFLSAMEEAADPLLGDTIASETVLKSPGMPRVASILFYLAPYGLEDGKRVADGYFVRKHYGPVAGFRERVDAYSPGSLALPPPGIPETALLGITHPVPPELNAFDWRGSAPSVLDIEIAAFVVEENPEVLPGKLRGEAWLECFFQLMLTAFDRSDPGILNFYAKNFYVPADDRSQIMYRNIFLEMQRAYLKDGKWVIVKDTSNAPSISAHEVEWRAMTFHPLNIQKFAQSVASGTTSRLLPSFNAEAFLARARALDLEIFLPRSELAIEPKDDDERTRAQLYSHLAPLRQGPVHLAAQKALDNAPVELSDRREAIEYTLKQITERANQICLQLPEWLALESDAVKTGIAWMGIDFAHYKEECRGPLSSSFLLRNATLPLLVGPSGMARFDALYGLRFSYTRSTLLAVFGFEEATVEPNVDELEHTLRADLLSAGLSAQRIDWWVEQIRGFIPYTHQEPYRHWERASYADMEEELGVAPLLGNAHLFEKILLLGILRPAELIERALNTIPYED